MAFALDKAGKSNPARIAMMAITTSNSIKVKPELGRYFFKAKKNGPYGPLKDFLYIYLKGADARSCIHSTSLLLGAARFKPPGGEGMPLEFL